jgi:hypothetical protein
MIRILYKDLIEFFPEIIQELKERDINAYNKWKEFSDIICKYRDEIFLDWRDRTNKEDFSILDIQNFFNFREVHKDLVDPLIEMFQVYLYCGEDEVYKRKQLFSNIIDKKRECTLEYIKELIDKCLRKLVIIEDMTQKFTGWDENERVNPLNTAESDLDNAYDSNGDPLPYLTDFKGGIFWNELDYGQDFAPYSFYEWFIGFLGILFNIIDINLWTNDELKILYKIIGYNKPATMVATVGYYDSNGANYVKYIWGADERLWLDEGNSPDYRR